MKHTHHTVNKLDNKTADVVGKIQAEIFALIAIVDKVMGEILFPFVDRLIPDTLLATLTYRSVKVLIIVIVDVLFYNWLKNKVKSKYDKKLISANKERDIGGEWHHIHIPEKTYAPGEIDYSRTELSAGVTKVVRDFDDYTFRGINSYYHIDKDGNIVKNTIKTSTTWETKAARLTFENGKDLVELYHVENKGKTTISLDKCPCCQTEFKPPISVTEASSSRYGMHRYNMIVNENGFCEEIHGEYADCHPSLKSGQIYLFRDSKKRDDMIRQYFEEQKKFCPVQ